MSLAGVRCPVDVAIRYLDPRDLPQVLQLAGQFPAPNYCRDDFYRDLGRNDLSNWVAVAGNRVIGFVISRLEERPDGTVCLELLHLAVAADWQRRGVGRMLLKRFEDRLGRGCIQATVPETNLPVQMFLRAAGYKALRVLRGHFDGADAYVMERRVP